MGQNTIMRTITWIKHPSMNSPKVLRVKSAINGRNRMKWFSLLIKSVWKIKNRNCRKEDRRLRIWNGIFYIAFLDAGASAIALDIDDRFLNYINTRTKDHKKKTLLELRKINEGELGLKEGEVDLVFTVNTYHHFENRISFLSMIKNP